MLPISVIPIPRGAEMLGPAAVLVGSGGVDVGGAFEVQAAAKIKPTHETVTRRLRAMDRCPLRPTMGLLHCIHGPVSA
jgi:hypothetical protein